MVRIAQEDDEQVLERHDRLAALASRQDVRGVEKVVRELIAEASRNDSTDVEAMAAEVRSGQP